MPSYGRGVYHKVAASYFVLIMYIVQLYKDDWTILQTLGCRVCSPEQWFQLSTANTAQTVEEFGMIAWMRKRSYGQKKFS